MARRKRQYGTGCLLKTRRGWDIRWRETEIAPDGTRKRVLRYETLGNVSRKEASTALAEKVVASRTKAPRSLVKFETFAAKWQSTVLPMFKHSTQKNRRFFLKKHLLPRFGDRALSEITREQIQAYVTHLNQDGYAPKSIDNIHDALSAVLRTAVEWEHLPNNPALGVRLPKLRAVRPKWALTSEQALALLGALQPLPRAAVGLALLCGLRRGELFALQWADVHEQARELEIRASVYDGVFGTPKTDAGARTIPLSNAAVECIADWKAIAKGTEPDALVFSTRSGKPISPNNILNRHVLPACATLGIPHCSWLTFRRTYSSWAHSNGVPGKVVARLMGHANVDTTLNVYTQVIDGSMREAAEIVSARLFRIVQKSGGLTDTTLVTH